MLEVEIEIHFQNHMALKSALSVALGSARSPAGSSTIERV